MTTLGLPTRERVLTPSQRVLRITDGDPSYNTAAKVIALMKSVPTGQKSVVWARTIRAQEAAMFGYTGQMPPYSVGRFNFAGGDVSAANDFVQGELTLVVNTADGRRPIVVDNVPIARLHAPTRAANAGMEAAFTNDIDSTYPMPMQGILAEEDDLLQLEFSPYIAVAAGVDGVSMSLPTTRYS